MVRVIASPCFAYDGSALSDSSETRVKVGFVLSIVTALPAEDISVVFPVASAKVNA